MEVTYMFDDKWGDLLHSAHGIMKQTLALIVQRPLYLRLSRYCK